MDDRVLDVGPAGDIYRAAFEHAASGVAILSADTEIVLANPFLCGLLGYEETELLGMTFEELSYPEDLAASRAVRSEMLGAERPSVAIEKRYVRKDGSLLWARVDGAVLSGDDGNPAGFIATLTDITERKQSEDRLSASELRFSTLFQTSPHPVHVNRMSDGLYLDVNEAFCALTGYSALELSGRTSAEMGVWADLSDRVRLIEVLDRDGEVHGFETSFRDREGAEIPVLMSARIMALSGELCVVSISADVSTLKAAEDRIRKLNRLYTVLSNVNQVLVHLRDPQRIFDTTCRVIVEDGEFAMAWVGLVAEDGTRVEPVASAGGTAGYLEALDIPLGSDGPVPRAIAEARHVIVQDLEGESADSRWRSNTMSQGYRSVAAFPMKVGDKVVGALGICSREPYHFDDEHLQLLDELAGDISLALDLSEREVQRARAEDGLRRNEELYRELFERAPLGYQSLDADGRFITVNEVWTRTLGYSADEVVGRWFGDLLAPDYVEAFRQRFPLFKEAGEIHSEFEMITKAGERRWIAFDGRVGHEADGSFKQTHCVLQDTTERRQAAMALHDSEERFRRAVESAPLPIMIHAEDGEVIQVSQAWTDITGYTRNDIPTTAEWAARAYGERAELVESDIDALYGIDAPIDEGDYMVRTGGGDERVWHFQSAPLGRLSDGRRTVISTAYDITERRQAEDEIRQGDARLRMALAAARAGTWEWDLATDENRWSDEVWDLYGLDRERFDASYASWLESVRPEERERLGAGIAGAAGRGAEISFEWRVNRDEAQDRWLLSRGQPVRDASGVVVSYRGIVVDITERKQAEQALLEGERALVEAQVLANLGSWSWDIEADVISWSDELYRMMGIDLASPAPGYEGQLALYAPESAALLDAAVKRALDIGESYEFDLRLRSADARERWVHARGAAIRDSGGRVVRLQGTVQDITERKQAQASLRESEQRYKALFQSANDAVYVLALSEDGPGRFLEVNERASLMLGYSHDEFLAMETQQIDVPEMAARSIGVVERLRKQGSTTFETEHVAKDGRRIPVEVGASLFDLGNRPVILSVARDITERKRDEEMLQEVNEALEDRVALRTQELAETIEQLTEANAAKTHFLRSMSHELRTPLNSVIGFSTMLADGMPGEVNEEQERQLLMIKNSGKHLLALINDILDLSKIEAGAVEFHFEPIDAVSLVDEVVSESRPGATDKGLDLTMETDEPVAGLTSDARSVRQILINLLGNAIKFTDAGTITVRVGRPAEGSVSISVADTGAGIAASELEHIFGEFERGSAGSPTIEGTGLGLAISLELATLLGGTLEVDSEVGVGSTFTLTLPDAPGADSA